MFKNLLSFILLFSIFITANADEVEIRRILETNLGIKVESITKSNYLGLYEVYADGNILYTDANVTAILIGGQLVDIKTKKNVTDERLRKLGAIKFSDLPLERAIKQVRGDGRRIFATFEDPACGYCKRLAKDIEKLDNVTIYTFLYPILSEDSVRKSNQIWCSENRAKAWNDWMVNGRAPTAKEDCDVTAIRKNQEFGRRLNISGIPTIFFSDGERVPGAMSATNIEQKLNQLAATENIKQQPEVKKRKKTF